MGYDAEERQALLAIAREGISCGVRAGRMLEVDPADHPERLREPRGCFVTLRRHGALRGCTGSLEAARPLVVEVARSAHRTALADPRFEPVTEWELDALEIHLSVLTPFERLSADSEGALLAALVPGRDGLVLHEGECVATFLPSVWEQLTTPRAFLRALRHKAGLPPDHWSPRIWFERYRAEDVG